MNKPWKPYGGVVLLALLLGIALGVLVGSVPLALPGLPAAVKLGLAGGPLVAAILLSRMATTGPLVWHMPHTANLMLREIGISLFLAAVGLKSGEKFVGLLLGPQGLHWLGYGILITFVPLLNDRPPLEPSVARRLSRFLLIANCPLFTAIVSMP